jgi:hypothetical protein
MRQHDERDLRAALREEADRHHPDRAAMLNRIAQGRSAPVRRPIDRFLALLRPAAAAVAVAVVLVLAVAGVRLSNRGPEVDDTQVAAPTAAPATPTPAPTATPKPTAAGTTTVRPPKTSTGTSSAPSRTTPATGSPDTRDGFLESTGMVDPHSNDGWSQGNVVLDTRKTIKDLDLSVTVALTPGVVETGRWTTVPTNMIEMTSTRTDQTLVYRFVLREGFTLAPGSYTFAVQFNHAAGKRSVAADSYVAEADTGGADAMVRGGFRPQ